MALHRQRDEQPPTVQHREPGTVHQGRFPSSCHRGRGGAVNSPTSAPRWPPGISSTSRRADRSRSCCGFTRTVRWRVRSAPRSITLSPRRKAEADQFYAAPAAGTQGRRQPDRPRAYAGPLWNKQFFGYVVEDWLEGDPETPPPPVERKSGRNSDWPHLFCRDVLSMPDKWEYPWFAAWDLAFHTVALARLDPVFARTVERDAPRMVHAPQWAVAGLRIRLERRQSAGPRLGLLGSLQGHEHGGRAAVAVPFFGVPEVADELHLVGEPQGLARQAPLFGRLPGSGQHRRVRPLPSAARRRHSKGRRHSLDGILLRQHVGHGLGAGDV